MVEKIKGKQWFVIVAPEYFDRLELAKTLASSQQALVDRRIVINAADLTGDVKKFFMKVILRISKVEGEKAFTEFDGFEILRDYLARMVVHRVRRIDIIQDLTTKDGVQLRVKVLATTSKKAKATIEKAIRARLGEMIKNEVENSSLEGFLKGVISGELRLKIMAEGRKTYPIRNFEFRKIERLRKTLLKS